MSEISDAAVRLISKELRSIANSPLEGITVIPNEKDLSEIHALIVGPCDTPYEGGEFRIVLKIGSDFPQAPPKGFFLTKIFHPNVSERGEICVNTLKKDWKETYGFKHILLTVKCLLIFPNPESSLNEEAGRLLLTQYEDYFQRAKIYTSIHAKPTTTSTTTTTTSSTTSSSKSTTTTTEQQDDEKDVQKMEDDDVGGEKENQSNNMSTATSDVKKTTQSNTTTNTTQAAKKKVNANKKRGVKRL
eukprot:TRINITY_DN2340_c0_g1_i1.p1 TRINITY_DN2340_c0_g1~~TRINITY_DN2340_c0_g1_i1.p1  ORF type:complete len:258 (-),score=62.72 TRINITY_DN2340_c0_g1_i1:356-1090(-)